MIEEPETCRWCGGVHDAVPKLCPYVKALEFGGPFGDVITRVEFLTPSDFGKVHGAEPEGPDYPRLRSESS